MDAKDVRELIALKIGSEEILRLGEVTDRKNAEGCIRSAAQSTGVAGNSGGSSDTITLN